MYMLGAKKRITLNLSQKNQTRCSEASLPFPSSKGLCLCTKSSTHSSILSASSVSQSHQCLCAGLLLCAGGALVVEVAVGARILLSKDAVASAKPDAEAARLESEDMTADIGVAEGKADVRV